MISDLDFREGIGFFLTRAFYHNRSRGRSGRIFLGGRGG